MPRVAEFIERAIHDARERGFAVTLLGRRRPIPELRAQSWNVRSLGERLAVNTVIQGSAADIIKLAMVRIHRRLAEERRGARLVLQIHDELLLEVPDVETTAVRELVIGGDGAAPTRSTRRSRSTAASATTGSPPRS